MPIAAVTSAVLRALVLRQPAITATTPTAMPTLRTAKTNGPRLGSSIHWWLEIHDSRPATTPPATRPNSSLARPSAAGEGGSDHGGDDGHGDDERDREVGAVAQPVVEVDAAPRLQDDGHPEDRQGEEHEREERDEVVEAGVLAQRRDDADADADDDRHDRAPR